MKKLLIAISTLFTACIILTFMLSINVSGNSATSATSQINSATIAPGQSIIATKASVQVLMVTSIEATANYQMGFASNNYSNVKDEAIQNSALLLKNDPSAYGALDYGLYTKDGTMVRTNAIMVNVTTTTGEAEDLASIQLSTVIAERVQNETMATGMELITSSIRGAGNVSYYSTIENSMSVLFGDIKLTATLLSLNSTMNSDMAVADTGIGVAATTLNSNSSNSTMQGMMVAGITKAATTFSNNTMNCTAAPGFTGTPLVSG